MNGELVVVDDVAAAFASTVVRSFLDRPNEGYAIALSGGSTARRCYEQLAADAADTIDWWKVDVYWGDERCVPLDDPDSNYRLARESLLDRVGAANATYPMRCDEGAEPYQLRVGELGQFDLVHLGLGPDGHTASLFPGTPILDERSHSVAAVHVPKLDSWRVSLTLPVLEHARRLLFLVAGSDKAAMVERVLGGANGEPVPVQRIQAGGEVEWHLDADAAALLDAEATS